MKTDKFDYSVENLGVIESTAMGFDKEGEVFIFETLRKGIYSAPILAVIREYSTNIFDAHVAAGVKDRPGEVAFPSFDKPEMIFRDFGLGMSQDDVRRIYSQYGASTKRNTNEQAGQLGLGSKAGFSYCDSFSIISRHNGIKSIYNAVIEEDGRGRINLLEEGATDEESGMEIIIPIKNEDIDTFIDTALEFYYYWDLRPILHNCFQSYPEKKYIVKTENYGRIEENKNSIVLMGGVSYVLDTKHLLDLTDGQRNTFNKQWVFFVPIGSVDFSSSREQLRYTPRTIEKVTALIISAITDYKFQLQNEFDTCPTLKAAKQLFDKTKKESLFYRYCHSKASWQGQEITNANYEIKNNENFQLMYYNWSTLKESNENSISPFVETIYYYTSSYLLKAKLEKIVLNGDIKNKIAFVKLSRESKIEDFITENNLQEFNFINLKTIEVDKGGVESVRNFNAKHQKKILSLKDGIFHNNSDDWVIAKVDMEEGGVYVHIDRFEVKGYDLLYSNWRGEFANLRNFTEKVDFARKSHPDLKIYGIKTSLISSLNSKWVELKTFCQNTVNEELSSLSEQDHINAANHTELKNHVEFIHEIGVEPQKLELGVAKDILSVYSELNSCPKIKKINKIKEYGFNISPRNVDDQIKIKINNFNAKNTFINYLNKSFLQKNSESQNFLIKNLA